MWTLEEMWFDQDYQALVFSILSEDKKQEHVFQAPIASLCDYYKTKQSKEMAEALLKKHQGSLISLAARLVSTEKPNKEGRIAISREILNREHL